MELWRQSAMAFQAEATQARGNKGDDSGEAPRPAAMATGSGAEEAARAGNLDGMDVDGGEGSAEAGATGPGAAEAPRAGSTALALPPPPLALASVEPASGPPAVAPLGGDPMALGPERLTPRGSVGDQLMLGASIAPVVMKRVADPTDPSGEPAVQEVWISEERQKALQALP